MGPLIVKSLWLFLGVAAVACAQASGQGGVEIHDRPATAEKILELIEQLSSAAYEQREAADAELRDIGVPAVDHLARAYQETDEFEARIRIQRIAEHVFFWDRVLGRNGFLGISHRVYVPPRGGDSRIESGKAAFEIARVLPGTSAERNGLKTGDLIVAVDGTTLSEGASPADFADLIRYKLPGTVMTFEFYRGAEHRTLRIAIGHRPLRHYGRAAPKELNTQFETAVREFPTWWSSLFGSLLDHSFRDQPTPDRPLFLELPSDYDDK